MWTKVVGFTVWAFFIAEMATMLLVWEATECLR